MFEGVDDVFRAFLFVSLFRRRAWLPGIVCKQELLQGTRRSLPLLRTASRMVTEHGEVSSCLKLLMTSSVLFFLFRCFG